MNPRLRPWLLGALLWAALLVTINAPRWLHCAMQPGEPGCDRSIWLEISGVGLPLGVMMLATVVGIRRVPVQGRWSAWSAVLLAVAIACLGLLASGIALMLHQGTVDIGLPSPYTLQVLLTQSGCMVAALQYMRRAQRNRRSTAQLQVQRQQLEQQLDAARLQLLQAQVEPHFLFNTLAHLRRLAQTDPEAARAMLADLLQYLGEALPELREAESLLERELRLVRAYLALHQRRMGETRLRVAFDVEPGLARAKLPSTALLTLAENAIKHGIAPLVTGGQVRVSARRQGEQLLLELADTGRGMGESSGHGTGLATLRARLKALYGEAGQLQLRVNQPRGLIVSLQLPLQLAA